MLGAFLVVVSGAAVNVALPPIMTTFSMNLDEVQWVITAYMIASAVLIPTVGWLGNRLGNRNLFLLSLLIFMAGSALSGLAWSGGADLFSHRAGGRRWTADSDGHGPVERGLPAQERGLAMGLFGLAAAFGPAVGPVIGGYLTDFLSWRSVLFESRARSPVHGAGVPGPAEHAGSRRRSLDLPGLVTLAVFLVCLLIALSQGHRHGWDAPFIQRLFVVAG